MGKERVVLSAKQLEIITRTAANVAVDQFKQTEMNKKVQLDKQKFRDVKMLLKNYRHLKAYSEDIEQEMQDFDYLWDSFGLDNRKALIGSGLTEYNAKTVVLMEYVDFRLKQFEKLCTTEDEIRRFKIIRDLYLIDEPLTLEQAGEKYGISAPGVYKNINKVCGDLAVLFFGIEAVPGFRGV